MFAALGANVFAFSVDEPAQREAARSAVEKHRVRREQKVEAVALDVSDREAVERVLSAAAVSFGPPDVVLCSAGIGGAVYFENLSFERFDRTMQINLYGTRHTIAALLPFMKGRGGQIVTVSSMSGLIGLVGYTAYATSKFAVVGFSQSLRAELKRYGIWVSVLCPPQVATPLLEKADRDKPPETKAINDRAGLLQPAEVAAAIVRGIEKKQFLIIPGRRARLFHLFHRLAPTWRERLTDRVVRRFRRS
ncbi:MAG: SDR family NAD(P)-dependent oxidoreductase [Myxococcales bacterium]|nr:SDR family NAD(P)-dependent oxidoreductase [Myxococcales bacterium]